VMIVQVRSCSPSGSFQLSHKPAKANGSPEHGGGPMSLGLCDRQECPHRLD